MKETLAAEKGLLQDAVTTVELTSAAGNTWSVSESQLYRALEYKLRYTPDMKQRMQIIADFHELGKELPKVFNKKFKDLSLEQQWKITGKADILGSLTDGEYGFGHTGYSIRNRDEVFADIYLAKKYGWNEYAEVFPALWKYIGEFVK